MTSTPSCQYVAHTSQEHARDGSPASVLHGRRDQPARPRAEARCSLHCHPGRRHSPYTNKCALAPGRLEPIQPRPTPPPPSPDHTSVCFIGKRWIPSTYDCRHRTLDQVARPSLSLCLGWNGNGIVGIPHPAARSHTPIFARAGTHHYRGLNIKIEACPPSPVLPAAHLAGVSRQGRRGAVRPKHRVPLDKAEEVGDAGPGCRQVPPPHALLHVTPTKARIWHAWRGVTSPWAGGGRGDGGRPW
jgi:hypothetical protein